MSEVKTDLRIIKTKRSIYTAFLELLETKAFEEIKVSEICTGALVNRSTFYTHFEDKYMLLDCLIKDMKHILKNLLAENDNIDNSKAYYMEVMKILFDHIVGLYWLQNKCNYPKEDMLGYLEKLIEHGI